MICSFRNYIMNKKFICQIFIVFRQNRSGNFFEFFQCKSFFPIMPPIMRADILAVIAATHPLLIHFIQKPLRHVRVSKCGKKRNAFERIHCIWGFQSSCFTGTSAQIALFRTGWNITLINKFASFIYHISK